MVILLLWEVVSRSRIVNPLLFPAPTTIGKAFIGLVADGTLLNDAKWSFYRYSVGFIVGNLLGVVLGLLTGRIRLLYRLISPLLHYLRSTPSIALVPIAIVWFGIGDWEKIFIVIWGCTFPVWINTYAGTVEVEHEYIWAAQTLGAKGWRMYWEVYLPRALPYIIAGSRVSVSTGWFGLAAAEMAGAYEGLAFRIFHSHEFFQTPEMFVAVLSIGFASLLCDTVFVQIVRRLVPWWKS